MSGPSVQQQLSNYLQQAQTAAYQARLYYSMYKKLGGTENCLRLPPIAQTPLEDLTPGPNPPHPASTRGPDGPPAPVRLGGLLSQTAAPRPTSLAPSQPRPTAPVNPPPPSQPNQPQGPSSLSDRPTPPSHSNPLPKTAPAAVPKPAALAAAPTQVAPAPSKPLSTARQPSEVPQSAPPAQGMVVGERSADPGEEGRGKGPSRKRPASPGPSGIEIVATEPAGETPKKRTRVEVKKEEVESGRGVGRPPESQAGPSGRRQAPPPKDERVVLAGRGLVRAMRQNLDQELKDGMFYGIPWESKTRNLAPLPGICVPDSISKVSFLRDSMTDQLVAGIEIPNRAHVKVGAVPVPDRTDIKSIETSLRALLVELVRHLSLATLTSIESARAMLLGMPRGKQEGFVVEMKVHYVRDYGGAEVYEAALKSAFQWLASLKAPAAYALCLAQARKDLEGGSNDAPKVPPEKLALRIQEAQKSLEDRLMGLLEYPPRDDIVGKKADELCEVCGSQGMGAFLMLCGPENSTCPHGIHTFCLPGHHKLEVPDTDWYCGKCSLKQARAAAGKFKGVDRNKD